MVLLFISHPNRVHEKITSWETRPPTTQPYTFSSARLIGRYTTVSLEFQLAFYAKKEACELVSNEDIITSGSCNDPSNFQWDG